MVGGLDQPDHAFANGSRDVSVGGSMRSWWSRRLTACQREAPDRPTPNGGSARDLGAINKPSRFHYAALSPGDFLCYLPNFA
jgi:hypothetical protein